MLINLANNEKKMRGTYLPTVTPLKHETAKRIQ